MLYRLHLRAIALSWEMLLQSVIGYWVISVSPPHPVVENISREIYVLKNKNDLLQQNCRMAVKYLLL